MRQSKMFGKTEKEVAKDIKVVSHKLLYRAGFIRESVAGRYYFLPLGLRVRDKVVKIIEEEMNKAGAQKLITPVLHPLELWEETNRTNSVGFELMTIKDRNNSAFALGGTAEEMMVDLVRGFNISYKNLPFNIYQFSQKFRDELRARGGLLRVREFLMKDAYSFHVDEADFKVEYAKMWQTYKNIFERLGLKTVVVEADNGYIGGDYCHEFIVESEAGESKYLMTADGQYAAHEDVAKFLKEALNLAESAKPLEEVEARRGKKMEDGVKFHKLPLWQQLKDVLFVNEKGEFILAVIRGDLEVNEVKLRNIIGANSLRHATEEEIRNLNSEPGFISPVKIDSRVTVVADDSLRTVKNLYGGANKKDRDLLNVNIDRDFTPAKEGDIALAKEGYKALNGATLQGGKGIEVGNIFQLGWHYSQKMKATFTAKDGTEQFYYMGCYGIGIDRTIATVVEKYNDEKGIIWPEAIAPFQVHLVSLGKSDEVQTAVEKLYTEFTAVGLEVLFDDREDSAGVKLNDSDLLGLPVRVIVSDKCLAKNSVEVKRRNEQKAVLVDLKEIISNLGK